MSWISTVTGRAIDYNNVHPVDINILDIAVGLSNICRFSGQIRQFYSVAQHSVIVSELVPDQYALEALLHDASEAYCCDIPTPLKRLLPEYRVIEHRVDTAIRQRFSLPGTISALVKEADIIALATEKKALCVDPERDWPILRGVTPAPLAHLPFTLMPHDAEQMFLRRYAELTGAV